VVDVDGGVGGSVVGGDVTAVEVGGADCDVVEGGPVEGVVAGGSVSGAGCVTTATGPRLPADVMGGAGCARAAIVAGVAGVVFRWALPPEATVAPTITPMVIAAPAHTA
jgi:hypothetical protein